MQNEFAIQLPTVHASISCYCFQHLIPSNKKPCDSIYGKRRHADNVISRAFPHKKKSTITIDRGLILIFIQPNGS